MPLGANKAAMMGTSGVEEGMTATGGTITTDGSYKVHTFNSSGTFTVTNVGPVGTVDYLVIAGGGGAGSQEHGGGGGAGGYRNSYGSEAQGGGGSSASALSVSAQAYSITVGAGGTGGAGGANNDGAAGNNSVFSSITSTAGGAGKGYPNVGGTGGSGGGSGGQSGGNGGSGTANQGYDGGGNNVTNGSGGGGGGAGAAGQTTTSDYTGTGGNGGNGVASAITGSSVTRGGGGAGGANTVGSAGSGGGGSNSAGTANTGGGGGGQTGSGNSGKNGGSGVVIIRYQYQQENNMAHFARLDENNIVVQVVVVSDEHEADGENWCKEFFGTESWKQTSYNTSGGNHQLGGTPFRKNYAGNGYTYDEVRDAFIPPKPFPSWSLDENTCLWEAPTPKPDDGLSYKWNESTQEWDAIV